MTTIVHDLQPVQCWAYRGRGVGRYTADLARALDRRVRSGALPGVDLVFMRNESLGAADEIDALGLEHPVRTRRELEGFRADLLHTTGPMDPERADLRRSPVLAQRHVVTCYDLIPLRFPERYLVDPVIEARYRSRLGVLLSADAIVADSRSAAADVEQLLGLGAHRITSIGGGCDDRFRAPVRSRAELIGDLRSVLPTLPDRFVLAPTGWDWRKNNDGLVAAFGRLPEDVRRATPLVIVAASEEEHRRRLDGWCDEAGLGRDEVVLTGHLTDDDLIALYQTAELVVLPSRYEGFGLPVVEARRCGAVVVCADNSALREVLTEPLARFDADDIDQIGAVLHAALTDESFRSIVARSPVDDVSWDVVADRLVRVYEQVLGDRATTIAPAGDDAGLPT